MKKFSCILLAALMLSLLILPAQAAQLEKFATGRFSDSYAVYEGPGSYYYRSNNGKATYGAGGVARIYGVEGSWLMIGYQLGSGDYRIGYIEKNALKTLYDQKDSYDSALSFSYTAAYTNANCNLTDDPIINNKAITTLAAKTPVTLLGYMGTDWAYVEVTLNSALCRAFVRSSYISIGSPSGGGTTPQAPYVNYNAWDELPTFQTVRFSDNYDVYSGPGTYYYRANSGKALVGAGGANRVYGVTGNWALIGYELSSGDYRIGYISSQALEGMYAPTLQLVNSVKTLRVNAKFTDDPIINSKGLTTLQAGTSVTFLAYLDSNRTWAYVEVYDANLGGFARGFVSTNAF